MIGEISADGRGESTPAAIEEWVEEWKDYARSAGLTDVADINNVGRWIKEDLSLRSEGLRAGKAAAVADALARKGFRLDRASELAIDAALAAADAGDAVAQCRHLVVFTRQCLRTTCAD